MSFIGDLFGGGSQQIGQQVVSSEPAAYVKPFLEESVQEAQDLFRTPREYFPNQTFTDFSPTTLEGLNRLETRAMMGNPLVGQAGDFLSGAIGGNFLNPAANMLMSTAQGDFLNSNPYLEESLAPVRDQVTSQFARAGRLGSGANTAAMTRALAPVYAQNFARERANQLNAQRAIGNLAQQDFANRRSAAAMAPGLAAQDYSDIGQLLSAGQARDRKAAEALASEIQRFNFLENEPAQRLSNYITQLRGGTVGSTRTAPIYGDPLGSTLGNIGQAGQAAYFFSKAFPSFFGG